LADKLTDCYYQLVNSLVSLAHAAVGLFKLFLNPVKSAARFGRQVGNELSRGDLIFSQNLNDFFQTVYALAVF
jgi:hypothetical protein